MDQNKKREQKAKLETMILEQLKRLELYRAESLECGDAEAVVYWDDAIVEAIRDLAELDMLMS